MVMLLASARNPQDLKAGKLARTLDPSVDIRFQNIQLMFYGSIGAIILGFVSFAIALKQPDKIESALPETPILQSSDNALEIARNRFARGEITAEEYEDLKKRLSE